jgi:hypothetical protein
VIPRLNPPDIKNLKLNHSMTKIKLRVHDSETQIISILNLCHKGDPKIDKLSKMSRTATLPMDSYLW